MFHAGGTMTPRQSICAASVLLYSAHTSGSSPHKRPPGMRRKAMSLPTPTSYFYATTTSSTSTSTTTSPFIVSFTKTSTPPLPQPHHTPQWPCWQGLPCNRIVLSCGFSWYDVKRLHLHIYTLGWTTWWRCDRREGRGRPVERPGLEHLARVAPFSRCVLRVVSVPTMTMGSRAWGTLFLTRPLSGWPIPAWRPSSLADDARRKVIRSILQSRKKSVKMNKKIVVSVS